MNNNYGVIFDMDGVLVESYQPHFESWKLVAKEFGVDMTEEHFAHLFGRTSRDIIRDIWGDSVSEDRFESIDKRKENLYRELIRENIPVTAGLLELLMKLKDDGVKMAVGSFGPPENVDVVLDGLQIRSYFDAIITGMDVTHGKPDPQVFLLAAEKMGIDPTRCVVIEDAPAGIEAAHRAGMKAIGLTTSHPAEKISKADLVLTDLTPLIPAQILSLLI